ncbi:ATP-binding protein [Streptomyces sp. NPDC001939]
MDPHHHLAPTSNDGDERSSMPPSSELSLLTYKDLAAEIRAAKMRATSAEKRAAWGNLLLQVESIAGESIAAWDPTAGDPWHLTSLEIDGFQGVTEPFSFQFDPTPGVTIIHGPNGSGKSSISDGIRAALSGKTDWWAAVTPGNARSGKSPLWEKVNCARDSDKARVQIELMRGEESLTLTSHLGKDGVVHEVESIRRNEVGDIEVVDISSTPWRYAMEGHPPVFSYADVERRVQKHEDLQKYIENLLALGGCFDFLDRRVLELSEAASNSRKKLAAALKSAKVGIERVDREFRERDSAQLVEEISWSEAVTDMKHWLAENGLSDRGADLPQVTREGVNAVAEDMRNVDAALELLHGSHVGLHHRLANSLTSLRSEVEQVADPGYFCPVCDSESADWVDRLGVNLSSVESYGPKRAAVNRALQSLRSSSLEIGLVLEVLSQDESYIGNDFLTDLRLKYSALAFSFDHHGTQPVPEVISAFLSLREITARSEWEKCAGSAIELSDLTRQWRLRRRAELDSYVATWETEHEIASLAGLWEATRDCITNLADRLRKTRTSQFEGKAGIQVSRLLEDAGIVLESVNLSRTRAEIEVHGLDGQKIALAMLSAGQRNAFLLAPLFATAEFGPFGFLVLDDPVHSFDEVRVDRLAAVIADLGRTRRVIVLTHDERLKEHLLARSPLCEAWAITRDAVKGALGLEATDELWRVLIEDAMAVWQYSPKPSPTGYLTEVQIIRGLLRQALDNALHQCVVKYSLKVGASVSRSISTLDASMTTQSRMEAAAGIIALDAGVDHPVVRAKQACGHHLNNWNNAAHGNGEIKKADLRREIEAGLEACSVLGGWDF